MRICPTRPAPFGSLRRTPSPFFAPFGGASRKMGRDGVGLDPYNKIMARPFRSKPKILHQAAELRKQATPAEQKLWAYLRLMRKDGVRFRRQHAIGTYITDFCEPHKKLIIELDGSQHLEQEAYDDERTKYLELQGYKVIRYWNNDVMNNIEGVIRAIVFAMEPETHF
jgi:very-short-patch-repair endonuclease